MSLKALLLYTTAQLACVGAVCCSRYAGPGVAICFPFIIAALEPTHWLLGQVGPISSSELATLDGTRRDKASPRPSSVEDFGFGGFKPTVEGGAGTGVEGDGDASAAPFDGYDVQAAFNQFDADQSGTIDAVELTGALNALGLRADTAQAAPILAKYDADRSGALELVEFRALVRDLRAYQLRTPAA